MTVATREQFFSKRPRKTLTIEAPELGEGAQVTVQRPSARQRADWMRAFVTPDGVKDGKEIDATVAIVVMAVVDTDGKPLFTEADAEQIAELEPALLDRIAIAWQTLAKSDNASVERLAKN